jgi:predicted PurR-regulated permease PerM
MKPVPKKILDFNPRSNVSILEILQYTVLLSIILYFGKTLFIPFSFSILLSFILYPICKWLENKGFSKSISISICIFSITVLLFSILYLLFTQLIEFFNEWQLLKIKLLEVVTQISKFLSEKIGISLEDQSIFITDLINNSGNQALAVLQNVIYYLSEYLFILIMIPVFSTLSLYHRHLLVHVLYQIFSSEKKEAVLEILIETIHAYYNFIKGMLLVYLIVGILNSIGLAIIGIPHPFLFGFIASILTFIPYIGIMISSLLPITISWITFNSIWYPIGVIVVFSFVQLLEGYVIFPFAVGSRLKINTLAILITIVIGGILWGAAGMILFIPFISILKLIADRVARLKTLSLLLSDGEDEKSKKNKI